MNIEITPRGGVFIGIIFLLINSAAFYPSTILVLLPSVLIGYLVVNIYYLKGSKARHFDVKVSIRNSVLYRGEIDIIHFQITNLSDSIVPLVSVSVSLPSSMFLVKTDSVRYFSIKSKETLVINFPFLPTARGGYKIGPLKVAIMDGMKILSVSVYSVDNLNVRVFPRRLGSNVNHSEVLQTFAKLIGLYSSKRKGFGSEFHRLRDYIRGDPSKIVYWAGTARKGTLVSKEFEEEKLLTSYVVVQGGTTMRGSKFDFLLGVSMDLFQGIIEQNQPCGYIFFDNDVCMHYDPSTSQRNRLRIWSELYSLEANDVYADYQKLRSHLLKKRITNSLLIIIGDLENDPQSVLSCIRGAIINKNHVIFLDIWGYQFSYKQMVLDTAMHLTGSQYGTFLKEIMNTSIEQEEMLEALKFKEQLLLLGGTYGYFSGPSDNIVEVLKRALFSRFGRRWRQI